jgi:golgi-specific brefeldin A-resistance guanine nucleotide exchange factor 1
MLNTDLHNPQVRVRQFKVRARISWLMLFSQKRMTIEDYQRNLRGVNDGSDFSPEYLVGNFVHLKFDSDTTCSKLSTTP